MIFNKHSDLEGRHAFLGASKYSWLRYSSEKLRDTYFNQQAKLRGLELHEFANQCIRLGQKLPATHKTLNMFVNDAIGYIKLMANAQTARKRKSDCFLCIIISEMFCVTLV